MAGDWCPMLGSGCGGSSPPSELFVKICWGVFCGFRCTWVALGATYNRFLCLVEVTNTTREMKSSIPKASHGAHDTGRALAPMAWDVPVPGWRGLFANEAEFRAGQRPKAEQLTMDQPLIS